jgi:hypothetical protein
MNQGTQGYSLMKKTEGQKSRDTVSLRSRIILVGRSRNRIEMRLWLRFRLRQLRYYWWTWKNITQFVLWALQHCKLSSANSSRYISGDSMSSLLWFLHGLICCCPIKLGGEISNYTGFLPSHLFPLTLPSSLPFSMPALSGCRILTLEAPLITEKTPCMYSQDMESSARRNYIFAIYMRYYSSVGSW